MPPKSTTLSSTDKLVIGKPGPDPDSGLEVTVKSDRDKLQESIESHPDYKRLTILGRPKVENTILPRRANQPKVV